MTKEQSKKLEKMVHEHTVRAMVDCADTGHGCNHKRAIRSADRLIAAIEKLALAEFMRGCDSAAKNIREFTSPG